MTHACTCTLSLSHMYMYTTIVKVWQGWILEYYVRITTLYDELAGMVALFLQSRLPLPHMDMDAHTCTHECPQEIKGHQLKGHLLLRPHPLNMCTYMYVYMIHISLSLSLIHTHTHTQRNAADLLKHIPSA